MATRQNLDTPNLTKLLWGYAASDSHTEWRQDSDTENEIHIFLPHAQGLHQRAAYQ